MQPVMRSRRLLLLPVVAAVALASFAPALAAPVEREFPGAPDTGLREFTPNDPSFDCSEPDDEDAPSNGGTVENCGTIWDAQSQLWGFAPSSTRLTAVHKDPNGPRFGQPMRSGISADAAWKTSTGRPDVPIAILDTGIRWDSAELRLQVALNAAELPAVADSDGNGVVSVGDFVGVADPAAGANGPKDKVDAQDLIALYSDGIDGDANGYVDDIAGWDFFDGDNDAHDASSYSSSRNHGTGRANDAVRRGHDKAGKIGTCPSCTFMPVRVWDTFVVPGDQYAMGAAYAADAGAKVIEVALGALSNSPSAQAATRYAYDKGVTLAVVSSDLNTANHNYPTNYAETIEVNGTVADTYGLGAAEANEFGLLTGVGLGAQLPVATYFRNSNLTQYGAHVHVSAVGDTGSFATGQAAGAFGVVIAAGKDKGLDLTPAEVKQIVTLSAEDVLPADTIGVGLPDPAKVGFDERFGYGRLDMGAAMAYVAEGKVPPTVLFRTPRWWQLLDPAKDTTLPVIADTGSRAASHDVVVEAARGVEPADGDFAPVLTAGGLTGKQDARDLGSIPVAELAALFPATTDFSRPPLTDVNEYAVTIRARVTDSAGNVGEDRRVVWLHSDPNLLPGFPQFTDRGGESSPRLADLNGDAKLEIVLADSGGRTRVLGADGQDVPFWNDGQGVLAPVLPEAAPHAAAPAYQAGVPLPRGVSLTPAIADLDGDGALEVIVTNSAGIVTVYDRFGVERFTVGIDREFSRPEVRTGGFHVKTGLFGAVSVGDVVASLPGLELVAGALDGRVYVWGADGTPAPGFPRSLNSQDGVRGAEIITIPTLAQLDGDPQVEIVVAGSEVVDSTGGLAPPESATDIVTAYRTLARRLLNGTGALSGASLAHAIDGDGSALPGWPVVLDALVPDVLPFIGPAHQFAAADVDGDGVDEVVVSNTSGEAETYAADGRRLTTHASEVGATADPRVLDRTKVLNLFEYPAIGDLEGLGELSVFKGGMTLGGLLNLVLVGQNLPFDHVLQGWDLRTGSYRPGFPAKVEDYMLLSQPAIADVDGLPGKEVLQGTGLYLVHAFNALGQEAPGFPKFTGGWNYATPAIGDLDGDGTVEMVSTTREGYLFAWSLDGTAAGNDQWWGAAHDDRSTSRHGTDTRPPAAIQGLTRVAGAVTWQRTGDDWSAGTPAATIVVVDGVRQELPGDATALPGVDDKATVEVWAVDEAGNRGLSAVLGPKRGKPSDTPGRGRLGGVTEL